MGWAGQRRFAAALFDVDGTLLDSTEFVLGAFAETLRRHGGETRSFPALATFVGPPLTECYQRLAPGLDPSLLCATHRAWQREHLHLVKPYPHAGKVLQTLRENGVRLAAVTARSKVSSVDSLRHAGLSDWLDLIISAEDAPRTKPHPDPLLLALERLGATPATAVMVGDTAADIEAGRAAGMRTIGAEYGFFGAALATSRPDWMVRDIREVVPLIL